MVMFETSKHVPKTEKLCCVFKDNYNQYNVDLTLPETLTLLFVCNTSYKHDSVYIIEC